MSFLEKFSSAFSQIGMVLFFFHNVGRGFSDRRTDPGLVIRAVPVPMLLLDRLINSSGIRLKMFCAADYELGARLVKVSAKSILFYVFIAYKMPGEFPSKSNHC